MLMHPAVPVQVGFPRYQLLVDGPSVTDGLSATNVVTQAYDSVLSHAQQPDHMLSGATPPDRGLTDGYA